jgi:2-phosphoglycerate kinase
MYKLYQHLCKLKNTRIIQMTGESGIGKTTLAK